MKKTAPIKSRLSRRASIMIMVVALLVLMALLGTAYIATVRTDRGGTNKNSENVQVDLLVDSVLSMCKTSVVADLFDGNGNLRPFPRDPYAANPASAVAIPAGKLADTFHYYNLTSTQIDPYTNQRIDWWLADRLPEFDPTASRFFWPRITLPLLADTEMVGATPTPVRGYFEDPTYYPNNPTTDSPILRFRQDSNLLPTKITLASGAEYPALFIDTAGSTPNPARLAPNTVVSGPFNSTSYRALAADTDGDGIGDAFFFRLPVGVINGVTYYAAARIVDNTAAINLNTAWGDIITLSTGPDLGDKFFPNSVNLDETMNTPSAEGIIATNEVDRLHVYRMGRTYSGSPTAGLNVAQLQNPVMEDGSTRNDFQFVNDHDAMWMQLARRPENPGFIPGYNYRYRGFSRSDMIFLGAHFGLSGANNSSNLEYLMPNALHPPHFANGAVRTQPYAPDDIETSPYSWGYHNFWYDTAFPGLVPPVLPPPPGRGFSRRPLFVTSNAVANAVSPNFMPENLSSDPNQDSNNKNDVANHDMLDYVFNQPLPPAGWASGQTYSPGVLVTYKNLTYIYADSVAGNSAGNPDTVTGQLRWEYQPYTRTPLKASLNTATFRELYRAYWQVMGNRTNAAWTQYGDDNTLGTFDPYKPDVSRHRQFRSSLRETHAVAGTDPANPSIGFDGSTYRFPPSQQMLLRAALAAVNTIDLRDADQDVTSRRIVLKAYRRDGNIHPVEVMVYGSEPQPFITEVYANANNVTGKTGDINDDNKNTKGYVAIELFNPYDYDLDLTGWKLGLIDRRRARTDTTKITIKEELYVFPSTPARDSNEQADNKIRAGGHLILENFRSDAHADSKSTTIAAAGYRPSQVTVTLNGNNRIYIPELRKVFEDQAIAANTGGELVLLRPRRSVYSATALSSARPYDPYNESNIYDFIPVDQFDFTGLRLHSPPAAGGPQIFVDAWHYVRVNSNSDGNKRWRCVYPGRYDAGKGSDAAKDPSTSRHEAKEKSIKVPPDDPTVAFDDSVPGPGVDLGGDDSSDTFATNNFPPIQINNRDFAGFNPIGDPSVARNKFPFGGFARVGDIMQVPFMGSYRVRELSDADPAHKTLENQPEALVELNSLPMDCSFADDGMNANDQFENIGRFCPLISSYTGLYDSPIPADPFAAGGGPNLAAHTYDFARRIFDYFTVIAPHEDYLPNINPDPTADTAKDSTPAYRFWNGTAYQPVLGGTAPFAQPAETTKNVDNGTTVMLPEDNVGVHGLININTANWKVLSTIPWTNNPADNVYIAKAIVHQRDFGNGGPNPNPAQPFRTLFDLHEVHDFPTNPNSYLFKDHYQPTANSGDADDDEGDFSPAGNLRDGVSNAREFEQQFLLTNRVSNLLTTRSDSFMAYVVVQGWRNANTPQAELVVQRRAGLLIDRSGVTPTNKEVKTMLIPIE